MKRIVITLLWISFTIIELFFVVSFGTPQSYEITFINYNPRVHRYVLAPKTIAFLPHSLTQLETHFANSAYNFTYYLEWNYFRVTDTNIFLKLKTDI